MLTDLKGRVLALADLRAAYEAVLARCAARASRTLRGQTARSQAQSAGGLAAVAAGIRHGTDR